jgi:hypothetical protein
MIAEGKGQLIDYGVMTKEGEIPASFSPSNHGS